MFEMPSKFAPSAVSARRFAALDLGSNTCKMLAVERAPDGSFRELVPYTQRRVSEHEQEWARTIEEYACSVGEYLLACRKAGVEQIHLVATAWVRERSGGEQEEFRRTIAERTGLDVEILSAAREAEYELCAVLLDRPAEPFAILKQGGKSTEIIVKDQGQTPQYLSCDLGGTRTLFPKFDQERPMPPDLHSTLRERLRNGLGALAEVFGKDRGMVGEADRAGDVSGRAGRLPTLIAYGGTAAELPYLDQEVPRGERELPGRGFADFNMHRIARERLEAIERRYRARNLEQRRHDPFLDPERANHILVAAALYRTALELCELPELVVNTRPMLWGILARDAP